jgi:hypothetical protein
MQAIQIVFDTNVLLTELHGCKEFASQLIGELSNSDSAKPAIRLTLDKEGWIRREYSEQLRRLEQSGQAARASNLRRLFEFISRMPTNDGNPQEGLIAEVVGSPPSDELAFLSTKGCDRQIEPAMFGIVFNSHRSREPKYTFVNIMEDTHLVGGLNRGYPNVLPEIRERYLSKNDHLRELLKSLLVEGPRPESWQIVDRILSAARACGNVPLEGERHEFKGTMIDHNMGTGKSLDTGRFSSHVFEDLPKTLSSMLNKDGGYIFLGVREKPTFEVCGFAWAALGRNEDEVQQRITNKLRDNIFPFEPEKVRVYIVKNIPSSILAHDKMLVAIQVLRKDPDEDPYRANGFTGKGKGKTQHKRAIWSRCGSQVELVRE